jgi:Flavodoxin
MIEAGTEEEKNAMRALVVYESMFGNTHVIADHIATGVATHLETTVVGVHDATADLVESADLVVVGGPTHVHGMSSARSRDGAKDMAAKDDELHLDPDAEGPGLRDWFDELPEHLQGRAAAFDTRVHASTLVTGQASKGITKRLRRHGFTMVVEPESFFVDKSNRLEPEEADRAEAWGRTVAETFAQLEG